MNRRSLANTAKRIALATVATASAMAVLATAMTSAPAGAATESSCTFNGSSGPIFSGIVEGTSSASPTTINVSCTGLPASQSVDVIELPLLAPLSNLIATLSYLDSTSIQATTSSSNGTLSFPYELPAPYTSPSQETCGATSGPALAEEQAEVNAGYIGCAIAVVTGLSEAILGGPPISIAGFGVLEFASTTDPGNPTLALSTTTATAGQTVNVSDAPGATSYWWLSTLASLGATATGGSAPSSYPATVTVGNETATSNVEVTPSSFDYADEITSPPTCGASPLPSCLTPPSLSGSFVVPPGLGGVETVTVTVDSAVSGFGLSQSATTQITLPPVPTTGTPDGGGYREFGGDGGVFNFGDANPNIPSLPSLGVQTSNIVASASTPDGNGYWLLGSDGGVFALGDAKYYGGGTAFSLEGTAVGIASTPDGQGYWIVSSSGQVLAEGDALSYGSAGSLKLNAPIVGIASTPDGGGYWLVASDGGIFAYGDATFYGSTGSLHLNKPIIGIVANPSGTGYWLIASDGGIFSYSSSANPPFFGSAGSLTLNSPIVGAASTPDGKGYWLFASDGGVFSYGDATFHGSIGQLNPAEPAGPGNSVVLAKPIVT